MRLTIGSIIGAAALAGLALAAPAAAQDTRSNIAEARRAPIPPEARAVDQWITAARLAEWARANHDASGLIVAARMIAEIGGRDAVVGGRSDGGRPSERADPGVLTVQALLDDARALSDGDEAILAEIGAVEAAAARGVVNSAFGRGPIHAVRDIEAQATYWFEVNARGGEVLRVAAVGDGDTDIDMIVRDEFGQEVCTDTAYDHYPVCTFIPAFSGRFRVDIINHGRVWTRTQILSN